MKEALSSSEFQVPELTSEGIEAHFDKELDAIGAGKPTSYEEARQNQLERELDEMQSKKIGKFSRFLAGRLSSPDLSSVEL